MTRNTMSFAIAVFLCAVARPLTAEAPQESEIASFKSVQQNKDYRVSLLGLTKGIAFLESQELVDDGGRSPGRNAVPWMRIATVIEKFSDKDEPLGFSAETAEGRELVGKITIKTKGHVITSRSQGSAEMDLDFPPLRHATFPTATPMTLNKEQSKVYIFTLSGKFQTAEKLVLRFSFGNGNDRRELVFKDVPMP